MTSEQPTHADIVRQTKKIWEFSERQRKQTAADAAMQQI
jgi:hypothetical protein